MLSTQRFDYTVILPTRPCRLQRYCSQLRLCCSNTLAGAAAASLAGLKAVEVTAAGHNFCAPLWHNCCHLSSFQEKLHQAKFTAVQPWPCRIS